MKPPDSLSPTGDPSLTAGLGSPRLAHRDQPSGSRAQVPASVPSRDGPHKGHQKCEVAAKYTENRTVGTCWWTLVVCSGPAIPAEPPAKINEKTVPLLPEMRILFAHVFGRRRKILVE